MPDDPPLSVLVEKRRHVCEWDHKYLHDGEEMYKKHPEKGSKGQACSTQLITPSSSRKVRHGTRRAESTTKVSTMLNIAKTITMTVQGGHNLFLPFRGENG